MGSTLTDLPEDLEEVLKKKKLNPVVREGIKVLIQMARAGTYHDFLTKLTLPKMTLNEDLLALGLHEIASKVRAGDYDDEYPSDTVKEPNDSIN